jgi:hypothetical protein
VVSSSTDQLSGKDNPFHEMMSRIYLQLKEKNGAVSHSMIDCCNLKRICKKRMLNPPLEHMLYEENVWVIEQKGDASANKK